jgi:pyruvate dehydrogenase E1 component alpha subunit
MTTPGTPTVRLEPAAQVQAFRRMLLIRRFEERCVELQMAGEITAGLSVAVGQEATAAALGLALEPHDLAFSNHRNHAHLLGRGADPKRVMAEVLGKATGYCGGRAGPWHISASDVSVPVTSAIVGAVTAQAVGAAMAFQRQHQLRVAVACMGDRSLNEGTAWEAINIAALWQVPVVFLCENNDAVPYDPVANSALAVDQVTGPIASFHMQVRRVEGSDLAPVYQVLTDAVGHARAGGGPVFVEVLTAAWPGTIRAGRHTYVTGPTRLAAAWEPRDSDAPFADWRAHDGVVLMAQRLLAERHLDRTALEQIDDQVRAEIDAVVEFARQSPWPDAAQAARGVFA